MNWFKWRRALSSFLHDLSERITKKPSEFGSGLVVNLVKFAEHFCHPYIHQARNVAYWIEERDKPEFKLENHDVDFQKSIEDFLKYYNHISCDIKTNLSKLITLWASGASDHLYEMEVPRKGPQSLKRAVIRLRHLGLRMGHGFTNDCYTVQDVDVLWGLVREIAINIDKKIGLKPDWGQW